MVIFLMIVFDMKMYEYVILIFVVAAVLILEIINSILN